MADDKASSGGSGTAEVFVILILGMLGIRLWHDGYSIAAGMIGGGGLVIVLAVSAIVAIANSASERHPVVATLTWASENRRAAIGTGAMLLLLGAMLTWVPSTSSRTQAEVKSVQKDAGADRPIGEYVKASDNENFLFFLMSLFHVVGSSCFLRTCGILACVAAVALIGTSCCATRARHGMIRRWQADPMDRNSMLQEFCSRVDRICAEFDGHSRTSIRSEQPPYIEVHFVGEMQANAAQSKLGLANHNAQMDPENDCIVLILMRQ